MGRVFEKLLNALARGAFALAGWVASITRASLAFSMCLVIVVFAAIGAALVRHVGVWTLIPTLSILMLTMLRIITVLDTHNRALNARDFETLQRMREIVQGKGEPRSAALRALKRVGDGETLLEFEKWKEAADVLATVDLEHVPPIARPGILTELGYARAHAGDATEGVATIERGIAQAEEQPKYPHGKMWHLRRRHGIALSLANEHARAIEVLGPVAEDFHGNKREWSEVFYFLGRSHSSESEFDAAAAALASAVVGEGPFVDRAWLVLEKIASPGEIASLREAIRKERELN